MSRIQNWDRWRRDCQETQDVVDQFSRVCHATRGHAYEAGWWSSTVQRLLMELPRKQREKELQQIQSQIKKMEAEQIMSALINQERA